MKKTLIQCFTVAPNPLVVHACLDSPSACINGCVYVYMYIWWACSGPMCTISKGFDCHSMPAVMVQYMSCTLHVSQTYMYLCTEASASE